MRYYKRVNMTMTFPQLFLPVLLTLVLTTITPAHALESHPVKSPRASVTAVSDVDQVERGKPFHIGLRFKLTPGWHIYWHNPGDAGQAPAVHVALSDTTAEISGIEWPTPLRIAEGPAMVFAYRGDVTLPIMVTLAEGGQTNIVTVDIDANWLVCAEDCIPEKGTFHLSLPIGSTVPSRQASFFVASAKRLPQPSPFVTHIDREGVLHISDKNLSLRNVSDAWFFPDRWGMIDHPASQKLSFDDDGLSLALKPGPLFNSQTGLTGVLVVKNEKKQEHYYLMTITAPEIQRSDDNELDFGHILLFALLGGLILNLMPCVFPILAMKALGLADLAGAARRKVRGQAIFYVAGVLSAFTIFDGLLLILRVTGTTVGWGFQFQSPVFVMTIGLLLFALGLNLSGVYEIGGAFVGLGQRHTERKGIVGSYCTGLLAVVVATPCVAPFIGVAVAAALIAAPVKMLAIFLTMGIGLALPYAALAIWPGMIYVLPRPGRWMLVLKQVLAFPLYGASAWLLWVLSQQVGSEGVGSALTSFVVLGFAGWLIGQVNVTSLSARWVKSGGLILAACFTVGLIMRVAELTPINTSQVLTPTSHQELYTPTRLASLRALGTPVFINMTAAWCITCLVNDIVAISTDPVQQVFAKNHIAYLKGDWTQQDPDITQFLHTYGHDGVPLYVFYPSGADKNPVLLPQILTPSIIIDVINHPDVKGLRQ
jgi:thiol:disulfide interchange protein/DsbC/DsbD-like thiol-disulfide interchange protein